MYIRRADESYKNDNMNLVRFDSYLFVRIHIKPSNAVSGEDQNDELCISSQYANADTNGNMLIAAMFHHGKAISL